MKKVLRIFLGMGLAVHGSAMASSVFIDFRAENSSGTAVDNNILSVILEKNKPGVQQVVSGSANVTDMTGSAILTLDSATFTGCNAGANLTTAHFNSSSYPNIYNAFADAPKSVWESNIGRYATSGGNSMELVFSGLAANTEYTFYLMGGRSNASNDYSPAFSNVTLTIDGVDIKTETFGGANSHTSLNNNIGMFKWTFTTGADWQSGQTVTLSSANGVYNAMKIDAVAVPEPSAVTLGFLPMAALLLRRRRR